MTNFRNLENLDLSDNNISGEIPPFLSQIASLQVLSLRNNSLKGSISSDLANLTDLRILDLSNNNLTGNIPSFFGNLQGMKDSNSIHPRVVTLDTGINDLITGAYDIVATWKKSKRNLSNRKVGVSFLDLSKNKLHGQIPFSLGNLTALKSVNISHNHLSGIIPDTFGGLQNLEALDMSHNKLSGQIPQTFENLGQLNLLDLSNNRLMGQIPSGFQMGTLNDPNSYANNSGLCGIQIQVPCQQNSTPTKSSERKIDEQRFSWEATGIGFPFGIVLTFVVVYRTHYLAPHCLHIRGK